MSWPPDEKDRRDRNAARQARAELAKFGKVARAPRKAMEADIQITVAEFLRLATIAPARFWFCPNGGNLSKTQRGKFKAMGLTAGVSDLHFLWRDGSPYEQCSYPKYGVIEMKAGKGKATDEQVQFQADVDACGHYSAICWSLDEVVATLTSWGYPLRARL